MSMQDGIVRVIFDPDGYIVAAGELEYKTLKERRELGDMMSKGYIMKTMHIDEYKASKFKWHWENPKSRK